MRYLPILLIVVSIVFVGCEQAAVDTDFGQPTPEATVTAPITQTTHPDNWQQYQSMKYAYSFAYPKDWYLMAYDEDDPQVLLGTHTLVNYDTQKAEENSNHGLVNWEAFMGDRKPVKIDLSVRRLGEDETFEEHVSQYTEANYTQKPRADFQLDNLPTIQYSTNVIGGPFTQVNGFFAKTEDNRVVTLYIYTLDPGDFVRDDIRDALTGIFSSFTFQ